MTKNGSMYSLLVSCKYSSVTQNIRDRILNGYIHVLLNALLMLCDIEA